MSTEKKQTKVAMSEEVAVKELESFLANFIKRPPKGEVLKERYPESVDALVSGNLIISETGEVTYKLLHPITGEFGKSEISFKTRVKLSTQMELQKGIKDPEKKSLVLMCHIMGFDTVAELDLLHKWDLNAAAEIASVFI